MKKTISTLLILAFIHTTTVWAAGPIETSGRHAATALAAQTSHGEGSSGHGYTWAGVALMGAGVALIAVANGPAKKDDCSVTRIGSSVITECVGGTNTAVAVAGLAAIGVGATMTVIGVRKDVRLGFGRRSASMAVRF